MSDYEKVQRGRDAIAERMKKSGTDSETAHRESGRIMREGEKRPVQHREKQPGQRVRIEVVERIKHD